MKRDANTHSTEMKVQSRTVDSFFLGHVGPKLFGSVLSVLLHPVGTKWRKYKGQYRNRNTEVKPEQDLGMELTEGT